MFSNRSFFWLVTWTFLRLDLATAIASACQVSDQSQMMCGDPEVDLLLSSTWPLLIIANSLLAKACLKLPKLKSALRWHDSRQ